jgi:hypothetical protein
MKNSVELQNIEDMRRREGIEDVELRDGIRALRVGHFVRLTLLTGTTVFAGETVLVRITSIRGQSLRGKLVERPVSTDLASLAAGSAVAFTTAHIHSLAKRQPPREGQRAGFSRTERSRQRLPAATAPARPGK